jgi:dTDP-4-dehydrorhamnose 3,5-epimerase-like enzyme
VLVKIKKFEPNFTDKTGEVYNLPVTRKFKEMAVFTKKKGTIFAEHYHKGKDSSKNPEIFILLRGKLRLKARDIETGKSETHVIEAVSQFEIPPYVYHTFVALEKTIFIESRKTFYDKNKSNNYYDFGFNK